METAIYLLLLLGLMGAFDTLYYHEWKARLPRDPKYRTELFLHALRDFAYSLVFFALGFTRWHGTFAYLLFAVLCFEIAVTLLDFLEEDRIRPLFKGERIAHTLMAIVYGAFLANLLPEMLQWRSLSTEIVWISPDWKAIVLGLFAAGVFLSGVRDLHAAWRMPYRV